MLEGVLAPVLERFLGQYIVDLPREQLRVGLWSGVLRLENVRLKPDAFDALKLPFAVRSGTIALLELKIAWKTLLLRSHPIVVTLDGIAVTASPRAEDEWTMEPANKRALALKRTALAAAAELVAQKRRGVTDVAAASSVLAAAVPTVLDRLRVKVGAVHVKFADMPKLAEAEDVAAFGLRLDSMLIATSRTEREPFSTEDQTSQDASSSGRDGEYVFVDANSNSQEIPGTPITEKGSMRKRRQRMLSGVRSVLAAVTPMTTSKKRIDVAGLRVYSRAKRGDQDGSPPEWYPAPRAPDVVGKLSAPDNKNWRAHYDDTIDPDDVVLGAETLRASLTVTARERSRPATTSELSTSSPGFDVRMEVLTSLETRIRPSQMRSAIYLTDASTVWGLRDKFGALRPSHGIEVGGGDFRGDEQKRKTNIRAWWRYAGQAVMQQTRESLKASPSLADFVTAAVPTEDAGLATTLSRYAELYEKKLRTAVDDSNSLVLSSAPSGTSAFDESFGEDTFFECDEDPGVLQGEALELYTLESTLTLEELLTARANAENAAYADEDDEDDADSFLDAEEFDFSSDVDDFGSSGGGFFGRTVGFLYKRGASVATNAVRSATSAVTRVADGASQYALSTSMVGGKISWRGDKNTSPSAGFVFEAATLSINFRSETSVAPSKSGFTLEFNGVRTEMDAPNGVALRTEIQKIEGYLPSVDSDKRRTVVWPRFDQAECIDKRSAVLRATQLDATRDGSQPPLTIDIAPFNVVVHPELATALNPFAADTPGTHQSRVLDATRRLPGDAPFTRIARAVASVEQQFTPQPWRLGMHQTMFLLPSSYAPETCFAMALEVTEVAAEYTAGEGVAQTPETIDALKRRAERLARRSEREPQNADLLSALSALENATTAHQVAMTFGGTRLLLPTPGVDQNDTKWQTAIDDWGGSALCVTSSSSVGGPAAATRGSVRFAPLRVMVTPETCVALEIAVQAASAFVDTATAAEGTEHIVSDAKEPPAVQDASDFEVSFGEISVQLETRPRRDAENKRASRRDSTSPPGVTFRAELRGVEARVCAERNGDTTVDVAIHDFAATRGGDALARVVAPSANEDESYHFARAEIITSGASGKTKALLRACGVELLIHDTLAGDVGAFAVSLEDAKSVVNGGTSRTKSPKSKRSSKATNVVGGVDDGATTALTRFGASASRRHTIHIFPGGAPDGTDGDASEAALAREAAWTSFSLDEGERFVRAPSHAFVQMASETAQNCSTFAVVLRSPVKVVLVPDDSSTNNAVASVEIAFRKATVASEKPTVFSSFGLLRMAVVETSVFIPGDVKKTASSGGNGFAFVLRSTEVTTRVPFDALPTNDLKNAPLTSIRLQGARLYVTRPEHQALCSTLTESSTDTLTRSCPTVFEMISMIVEEDTPLTAHPGFKVDIPLVCAVVTPAVVASAVEVTQRFAVAFPGSSVNAEDEKTNSAVGNETETKPLFTEDFSGALDVNIGRASLLLQSSETRVGEYGNAGDEVAALATATAVRFTARLGNLETKTTTTKQIASVEMSIESVHALDVSGTAAGEAERMSKGDALANDRASEAGVPLAWIGSTGPTPTRSVVAIRAEGNVFFDLVPESIAVEINLEGGGFVADVPALDRVTTLVTVLAEAAVTPDASSPDKSTPTPDRKKSVTFLDQPETRVTKTANARVSFVSGDWTVTLPWSPPDLGARALLMSLDTQASASVAVDVTQEPEGLAGHSFAVKTWRGDTHTEKITLSLRETAKHKKPQALGLNSYALASSPVFELTDFGLEVHSAEGSEWHEGVAVDVAVRNVTTLISQRRLIRLQEAASVLSEFLESSKNTEPGGDTRIARDEKRTAFTSASAVSGSLSVDTIGFLVLEDKPPGGSSTNIGPSLLEGAVLGAHGSLTFNPCERTLSAVAEAQTLLDALDHEKGTWEPVVEPCKFRLSVDTAFRDNGAVAKVVAKFEGVDALEITVGEASAATAAAAVRALTGAESDSGAGTRNSRTYWLHNATSISATYTLDGVATDGGNGNTSCGGTVSPGERVAIHFPGTETRAAPRYTRVGQVEPRASPAPAPPPARRRAVVVSFQDGSPPTAPIALDQFGVVPLAYDGKGTDNSAAVVAEVRRLVDDDEDGNAGDAALCLTGHAAARVELLLRSDLAFHNATLSPIELDFDVDDRDGKDAVRVEAGSRLWLPASLAGDTSRARWRPAPLPGADANFTFKWSEPIALRSIAERRVVAGSEESLVSIGSSVSLSVSGNEQSFKPSLNTVSSVTTVDTRGAATQFACVVSGRRDPKRLSAVVALAPQLYVTNALPVPVTLSASEFSTTAAMSRVIAPGDTAALHDAALDPASPITIHAMPHGFTHCESITVPTTHGAPPLAFEAFREVFSVTCGDTELVNALVSVSSVCVRVRVTVDDCGARRVVVSAPASVVNETHTPLVILAEQDPSPEDPVELESTLARLGMGARDLEAPERVASAGEGDCIVPAAASFPTETNALNGTPVDVQSVASPVPKRTRSREISNVDFSPEGRTRARLLEADGSHRATPSRPMTAVFRQSSDRAVSPLKPPVDVSVASPSKAPSLKSLVETQSWEERSHRSTNDNTVVPGVAMFGKSELWRAHRDEGDPVFTVVRVRAADSPWWSSTARLVVGDAPKVLKLPVETKSSRKLKPSQGSLKQKWTQCEEYLCSLTLPNAVDSAHDRRGTITVRSRFVLKSRVQGYALFVRQPGCDATNTVPPGGSTVVSRWTQKSGSSSEQRRLVLRPAVPGIWSWSDPVDVDRVGVTHVSVSNLHAATKTCRVYRVAVSASRDEASAGGFVVDINELGTREAANFAPATGDAMTGASAGTKVVSRSGNFHELSTATVPTSPEKDKDPHRFRSIAQAMVFVKKAHPAPATVQLSAKLKSLGVSLVADEDEVLGDVSPRELLYARATGVDTSVTAHGDTVDSLSTVDFAFQVGSARVDLQTAETASRPTVFAMGDLNDDAAALAVRTTAAFVLDNSRQWRARSIHVDPAPILIDLREVFGTPVPLVASRVAAPFLSLAESDVATESTASPVVLPTLPSQLGFQSVRIGRVDAVLSFAALPFLPAGVRSIGAVDRARVTLRGFALPSDGYTGGRTLAWRRNSSAENPNSASVQSFHPDVVARLAARHYLAAITSQVVRLVASNKLLGDPARLWNELEAATRDLWNSPLKVTSATKFSKRVASAVAAWAHTILKHAQRVTCEMEERFENARARRVERLRERHIAEVTEEGDPKLDTQSKELVSAVTEAGLVAAVVAGVLRAAGHLVEGPLQGAELNGVPGLVEGAAEGVFGAAAATASAALSLATNLADKLETYGEGVENLDDDLANEKNTQILPRGDSQRGRPLPPRLRAPRPPPTSRLEPWRPLGDTEVTDDID